MGGRGWSPHVVGRAACQQKWTASAWGVSGRMCSGRDFVQVGPPGSLPPAQVEHLCTLLNGFNPPAEHGACRGLHPRRRPLACMQPHQPRPQRSGPGTPVSERGCRCTTFSSRPAACSTCEARVLCCSCCIELPHASVVRDTRAPSPHWCAQDPALQNQCDILPLFYSAHCHWIAHAPPQAGMPLYACTRLHPCNQHSLQMQRHQCRLHGRVCRRLGACLDNA